MKMIQRILNLPVTGDDISRARHPRRKSWLDRGDVEFNSGYIKLKVLAGHSMPECMREIFSRQVIDTHRIIEA